VSAGDVSRAEVVAEVRAAFEAYEKALSAGDVHLLTEAFWDSPDVVRFGVADEQWGAAELAAWRSTNPSVPPGRRLSHTRITTFGDDLAVVSTLFDYPAETGHGRQSQTWLRMGGRWRIVHAHVSRL
jgi:ketosteroid isomerase-like protein